ncbi:hypothetical protein C2S51_005602 [Perilla frutescens var. frutescens]|nr:hypothetical protein C2S51_005602 [Perilla frutescens var. frutescens]
MNDNGGVEPTPSERDCGTPKPTSNLLNVPGGSGGVVNVDVSVDTTSLYVALIDKENFQPHPSSDYTSYQNYGEDYSIGLVDEKKRRKRDLVPIDANMVPSVGPIEINDLLSWNCRGLGQPTAISALSAFTVDCIGRSGGICVLWKEVIECRLLGYSRHHIDLNIKAEDKVWKATELPMMGYHFTWSREKCTINGVKQRLDRALVTFDWTVLFLEYRLLNLVAPISDHTPILLETNVIARKWRNKPFHFENKWFEETDLGDVVRKCWVSFSIINVVPHLKATSDILDIWGQYLALRFKADKRDCEMEIA